MSKILDRYLLKFYAGSKKQSFLCLISPSKDQMCTMNLATLTVSVTVRMIIVLIAKTGTKIHFDIAHLGILFYESAIDLEQKLVPRLQKMKQDTR